MTQWYVKDLSRLTQVSTQTLHHYDRIGLLVPSVRLANGYRVYSEKDLLNLQQIMALKFFGFSLSQIKTLLATDIDMLDHFSAQSQFLEEKAATLLEASKVLKNIISDCKRNKSIPWEMIIQLIEAYRMMQQLEKTWAGKVLSSEELKEYASFKQELNTRFTAERQKAFEKKWIDLVKHVDANLDKDPASDFGIASGKRCMTLVNSLYGKEHVMLRNVIWEKGFKSGHVDAEHALSPKSVAWLDKAIDAYYADRTLNVLNQVGTHPDNTVLTLWEALLTDMCGDEQALKDDFINNIVMKDDRVGEAAKNWLKKISTF